MTGPPAGGRDALGGGPGTFRAGTSGFAYDGWAPGFYPAGLPARDRLAFYADRLRSCELNNTFYARPSADRLRAWAAATPTGFRFVIKAQKGATFRAFRSDPVDAFAWLTADLPALGERLGAVLLRVPDTVTRDDARLRAVLAAWPAAFRLVVEARDPSWHVDETFAALADAHAALCATDLEATPEPDLRRTTGLLYVRLRRATYDDADIERWAARLAPFVAAGDDAYAVLRHDESGAATRSASALQAAVDRIVATSGGG